MAEVLLTKATDPLEEHVSNLLHFLTTLYKANMSYSTLNVARSVVSQLPSFGNSSTIGEYALAKQFFKGVFRQRPPLPNCTLSNYTHTWDVGPGLTYLGDLGPSEKLNTKQFSFKTVTLSEMPTIHLLSLQHLHVTAERLVLTVPDMIKQSQGFF